MVNEYGSIDNNYNRLDYYADKIEYCADNEFKDAKCGFSSSNMEIWIREVDRC